jgi:nicotinate-nucleotide adenylyltransferase
MLRLAIDDEPGFEISEVEIERGGISYTVDTLDALQSKWSDAELSLIMGADSFLDLDSWKQFDRVLAACNVLVATRPGVSLDAAFEDIKTVFPKLPYSYQPSPPDALKRVYTCTETGKYIALFSIPPEAVSSTEIRDALHRGKPVKKMLPPEVEGYIITHRLYQAHPHPLS